MTRERAAQLLPVIQAWANGEEIEVLMPGAEWRSAEMTMISIISDAAQWRVKPKLFEGWYVPGRDSMFNTRQEAERNIDAGCREIIHVREICE